MLWLKRQLGKELEGGPELESTSGHQCVPAMVADRSPRLCPHHEGRLVTERKLLSPARAGKMVAERKSLQLFPRMLAGQWLVSGRALVPQDGMQGD